MLQNNVLESRNNVDASTVNVGISETVHVQVDARTEGITTPKNILNHIEIKETNKPSTQ